MITTETEYKIAIDRYQKVKDSPAGSENHKAKMLIAKSIAEYEEKTSTLPSITDEEFEEIKKNEFKS